MELSLSDILFSLKKIIFETRIFTTIQNYYHILEISSKASALDIKKAFRKLALQYHPDVVKTASEDQKSYKDIYTAYAVLSNTKAKKQYDLDLFIYQNTKGHTHNTLSDLYLDIIKLYFVEYNQDLKYINQQKLTFELLQMFHSQNIALLNSHVLHPDAISIYKYLMRIVRNLNFRAFQDVKCQIKDLKMPAAFQTIFDKYEKAKKVEHTWLVWRPIFGFVVAIGVCLIIYFLSQ